MVPVKEVTNYLESKFEEYGMPDWKIEIYKQTAALTFSSGWSSAMFRLYFGDKIFDRW